MPAAMRLAAPPARRLTGLDAGSVNANDTDAFIAAAKTRQWEREKSVRTLA
jgi:hypothetical protein